jgi:hypothetical protein
MLNEKFYLKINFLLINSPPSHKKMKFFILPLTKKGEMVQNKVI